MTRILQVANSLDAYRLSLSLHLFPHRPTFDLFLLFPKRKIATITHFALAMLCYVGGIWKGKLERIVSKDLGSSLSDVAPLLPRLRFLHLVPLNPVSEAELTQT
jgi:hypothetical protein